MKSGKWTPGRPVTRPYRSAPGIPLRCRHCWPAAPSAVIAPTNFPDLVSCRGNRAEPGCV